ncbi:MAG: hypothetical protein HRU05_07265 [Oceanospirillaceae bacterium]|nr:hypothetical protein [Oceanospirillaceae bacterium]
MDAVIATVVKIEGKVSAIDQAGQKRELIAGDLLYVNEVVKTTAHSGLTLLVDEANSLHLESLQSLRLSADISTEYMSDKIDAVLNANLPAGLVEKLFSVFPLGASSILTDIEPVYDIERIALTEHDACQMTLVLDTILQASNNSDSLDQYFRFDQLDANTLLYFSHSGNFSDAASIELNADKILSINATGYTSSAELLSFLMDNYLIVDQV